MIFLHNNWSIITDRNENKIQMTIGTVNAHLTFGINEGTNKELVQGQTTPWEQNFDVNKNRLPFNYGHHFRKHMIAMPYCIPSIRSFVVF